MRFRRYFIALALFAAGAALAANEAAPAAEDPLPQQETPAPQAASFTVFVQGNPIGSEQVTVISGPTGWTIRATGRIGVPINLSTTRFEVSYDANWHPTSLIVESSLRGQPLLLNTTFTNGSAATSVTQGGQQTQKTDKVAPDTVVLPNMFFAAYEALALRLASVKPGAELRAYIAPQVEVGMRVGESAEERVKTISRAITARRYNLTVANPAGALPIELWTDEDSRLIRFRVPAQGIEFTRDDVASVSARVERMARPNDEQVRIQATGFSLAATISKPAGATAEPSPALVLLPGTGPVDRDETIAGIPVFAQLANALADAGFLVVRYDKRGIGQSGGRAEAATISDYADDARAVVRFLEKRTDVDKRRIVIIGHSEGGLMGMVAADREGKKVAALALVGTPGMAGGELVLEQQRRLLDAMDLPEAEKQSRIDLQKRIQAAVVSGGSWNDIPPAYRRQADTPWFRSYLTFDPAAVMSKVDQPIGVFHGERDREVPVSHARRLAELASARKKNRGADLFIIEGLNHLMVPAKTGEASEYPLLEDRKISASFIEPLVTWIRRVTGVQAQK